MDRYPYHWYIILLGATRALAHIGIHFTHRVFGLSMGRAHKLKLDHGQYCGSILGLGLSYMQPTMNPCGYLVVKQAEILRDSACMENKERS